MAKNGQEIPYHPARPEWLEPDPDNPGQWRKKAKYRDKPAGDGAEAGDGEAGDDEAGDDEDGPADAARET